MKKGTSPVHLMQIISELKGLDLNDMITKAKAKSMYNNLFSVQSNTTKISNLREKIVFDNVESGQIINTDKDGNGIDFIRATLEGSCVTFQIIQQKGNTGSLNANSTKSVLGHLRDFTSENKIESYFDRFEDQYNPLKTGYEYKLDVFLGYYLAVGNGKLKEFTIFGGDNYFSKIGIIKSGIELEKEVFDKLESSTYDAGATNFDEVYYELTKK